MRVKLGLLREYVREAVSMTRTTSLSAPTDADASVPGHLPHELAEPAYLDEEAWVPGRWMPGEGEPMSDEDNARLGDPIGMPGGNDDDLDETDARMVGDGKGNGEPDPLSGDNDDIASHLRGDDEKLALGSPDPDDLNEEIARYFLQEGPPGAGMVDPIQPPHGFYSDFDMDRDHGSTSKMQGAWYRSPGREPGGDGDPFRGPDAYSQLGFHPPAGEQTPDAAPPATMGQTGAAARRASAVWQLSAGSDTSKALGANAHPAAAEVGSEGEPEEGEESAGAAGEPAARAQPGAAEDESEEQA